MSVADGRDHDLHAAGGQVREPEPAARVGHGLALPLADGDDGLGDRLAGLRVDHASLHVGGRIVAGSGAAPSRRTASVNHIFECRGRVPRARY
jgi:hypothetical protein